MTNERFTEGGGRDARYAMAGCPCERCSLPSVWRDADGTSICPSYRKCGRYQRWFSEKWRAVKARFGKAAKG